MCIIAFTTNIKQQTFNNMRKHALPENIKYMFRSISTNATKTQTNTNYETISMEEQNVRSWIKQCFISYLKTYIDIKERFFSCFVLDECINMTALCILHLRVQKGLMNFGLN